jgi:hypothetical protein
MLTGFCRGCIEPFSRRARAVATHRSVGPMLPLHFSFLFPPTWAALENSWRGRQGRDPVQERQ